ncbi:MAG: hypothetical protein D6707_05310, partial [Bacteroidetes bacterium]
MRIKKTLLFIALFALSFAGFSQPVLFIDGMVREGKSKLPDAVITVYKNGSKVNSVTTADNGRFALELDLGASYILEFSKPGYVSKKISINTKGPPPEDAEYGYEYPISVTLFKEIEGLDVSILKQPIGKIFYNADEGIFDYDAEYTKSIQKQLAQLQADLERKQKEEAERLAKLEADYKAAMSAGEKALKSKNYGQAIEQFTKASELKPEEALPKQKLSEAQNLQKAEEERLAAEKAKEEEYNNLIASADKKFSSEDYE